MGTTKQIDDDLAEANRLIEEVRVHAGGSLSAEHDEHLQDAEASIRRARWGLAKASANPLVRRDGSNIPSLTRPPSDSQIGDGANCDRHAT